MALTLGFTSMDKATETALRAAFAKANEILQDSFTLADDSSAEFVVIDMDSMYGPMGWLRLHAAGKQVVGLTAAARTQADFRLGRPFDTDAMVDLLRQIATSAGADLGATPVASEPTAESPATPEPEPEPEPAPEAAHTPAPPTEPEPAAEAPAPAEAEMSAADAGTADTADASDEPPAPPEPEPEPEPAPEPEPEPEPPPRDPVFADWMQPGALAGRLRYRRGDGPDLWIDADARQYHGPQQLKPIAPCIEGTVEREDFESVDDDTWSAGIAAAGEAQPMLRLQWLGGLLAGGGELLPGNDPDGRYRLTKWPQTEREYPHHFRIATAMMKGPATLAEIAEAGRASPAEVADFTNASLATGFAEFVPEPEPEPETPARSAGFFSRLRGKS